MAKDDIEQRIRERAFHLWIEDGQPYDKAEEHWERARQEIEDPNKAQQQTTPQGTSMEGTAN